MNLRDSTLIHLVTMKPAAAVVFENHDLDYCCRGKQTLKEACGENDEKLKVIESELEEILFFKPGQPGKNFFSMMPDELTDYIVDKHHRYVKDAIPRIKGHLHKVAAKHGSRHPELKEIEKLFNVVADEMKHHMLKEERLLFPRIRELSATTQEKNFPFQRDKNYLDGPIQVMEAEHDDAGKILHNIRRLTRHYTPPQDACATFRIAFHELNEFENDLHRHVHLENNILFPIAKELFKKITVANMN